MTLIQDITMIKGQDSFEENYIPEFLNTWAGFVNALQQILFKWGISNMVPKGERFSLPGKNVCQESLK